MPSSKSKPGRMTEKTDERWMDEIEIIQMAQLPTHSHTLEVTALLLCDFLLLSGVVPLRLPRHRHARSRALVVSNRCAGGRLGGELRNEPESFKNCHDLVEFFEFFEFFCK